jgi:hypothetical protein
MPNEFMDVQQPMLRQVINTDLEPLYSLLRVP